MNVLILIVRLIVRWLVQAHARRNARLARELRQPSQPRPPHLQLTLYVSLAVLGLYALFPGVVGAQGPLFDPLANQVKTLSQGWFGTLQGLVTPTFFIVATIELCWSAAMWAFERDSLNS